MIEGPVTAPAAGRGAPAAQRRDVAASRVRWTSRTVAVLATGAAVTLGLVVSREIPGTTASATAHSTETTTPTTVPTTTPTATTPTTAATTAAPTATATTPATTSAPSSTSKSATVVSGGTGS